MTNKPKNIGTAAESAVVRYLHSRGYAEAERLALRGNSDHGDVRVTRLVHIEVKGGKAAENASRERIAQWVLEAEIEGDHSDTFCFLVTKKKGKGNASVGQWRAFMRVSDVHPGELSEARGIIVEMALEDAVTLLKCRHRFR